MIGRNYHKLPNYRRYRDGGPLLSPIPVLHGMPSILCTAAHENCPGIPEIYEQGGLRKVTDDTLKALGIIIAPMRTPVI